LKNTHEEVFHFAVYSRLLHGVSRILIIPVVDLAMNLFPALMLRLIHPLHMYRLWVLQRGRKGVNRVYDDPQLKLYHRLLPGDHLHYGYFDDPSISAVDMSLGMIYRAQERYANLLADLVVQTELPVLDVGCGMGGLLGVLNKRGLKAVGLTPDKNQAKHIKATYPNELLECRFEEMNSQGRAATFGSVITSESLQYLELKEAIPLVNKLLVPGGRWIACDYFREGAAVEKSGHYWDHFVKQLDEQGFQIVMQQDITPNILPTIAYAHHWTAKVMLPLVEFGEDKLKVKAPGWHYMLQEFLKGMYQKIDKNLATIDPEQFAAKKKYLLMVIERK